MSRPFDADALRAIRRALARDAYERRIVRIVDPDLTAADWLVASRQGLFGVSKDGCKQLAYGRFFGVHRDGDSIYAFESCGERDGAHPHGRIVRMTISNGCLRDPRVLASGLHDNCHQLALIDGAICVVDTVSQALHRFRPDGERMDVLQLFPPAPAFDQSGAYKHINSVARVGERNVILLHNGKAVPKRRSELAFFDSEWRLLSLQPIDGFGCHDIVEDESGVLWHADSMAGDLISSDGRRIPVTGDLMTRGLAFAPDGVAVGMSNFAPRHVRDHLRGAVAIFDRDYQGRIDIGVPAAPTDIVALGPLRAARIHDRGA